MGTTDLATSQVLRVPRSLLLLLLLEPSTLSLHYSVRQQAGRVLTSQVRSGEVVGLCDGP